MNGIQQLEVQGGSGAAELRTWYADTGRELFPHPNSVRYRPHRIEEVTGRPLSDPRAVLELGAALRALHCSNPRL
ncbi:helix-turn-helix domain-containing protein [Nocardia cyriacigeorgica]|uniref:PucR family transcriptional regulator n=1 Tax=Nocardia cyriacigeorgica TaxID=135487 RepID=A0A5R8NY07_9NOCA|nr:helix-turn-helix domain-containing protein [Nocardia cyriacigeorgica]TLF81177.1 PucR family transcriptional regulator [Nocardia cyriacigeorgica]